MSTLNSSPDHQTSPTSRDSSSSSSSSTLTDGIMISEVVSPQHSSFIHIDQVHPSEPARPNQRAPGTINTDCESSAAEDSDSHAPSSYENAEFALLSYSRTNKLDKLKTLLEAKIKNENDLQLNFKGQQKQNFSWSALHLACYFGHIQIVEYILSKKQFRDEIDINIQNNSGDTPLHKATFTNRAQIVQLLLANGASVFIKNCDGLLAKQLTRDKHILDMLEAAELVDKNRIKQDIFKAVDNGDLKKLQEYFDSYCSHIEASRACVEATLDGVSSLDQSFNDENNLFTNFGLSDLSQMTDERGNTLLHIAAMRGFKAICVFLLEQGFDPYRKNNLDQTCLDLSSYQLRQLFISVKPANNRLKKFSSQRVVRFEGTLLKKIRILGWRQIYAVLDNGVILLFNNRRESMNKSRRGYKYLESAICEPDPNDLGMFTICFSDRSRATFLVTSEHLSNYTNFKLSSDKPVSPASQIELVRQKWIDSIRDHIRYSTNFIKSGLKLNDQDDDDENCKDLSSLNHLLPVDTIKSFTQEARAHYSILERHAESLCNLIQSITSSRLNETAESSQDSPNLNVEVLQSSSPTSASNRFLGFMKASRPTRVSTVDNEERKASTSSVGRKRNDSLTNEFIQDSWNCILFHLRLLVESTQNTRVSMGQALALIEHQEQLRQNRIQDQDERCRVLEDSLHALARDHHELEKSLSMSQIYHSAVGRSMSMSTDLNEYQDAFEDFDDEKTVINSSDEDLSVKIREVINEDGEPNIMVDVDRDSSQLMIQRFLDERQTVREDLSDEDDDLRSNCSALTVETISDQYIAGIDSKQINIELVDPEACHRATKHSGSSMK